MYPFIVIYKFICYHLSLGNLYYISTSGLTDRYKVILNIFMDFMTSTNLEQGYLLSLFH